MTTWHRILFTVLTLSVGLSPRSLVAQQGPPPAVRAAIQSIERMLVSRDDAALQTFAAEHLAASYRASMPGDALLVHLRSLRDAVGGRLDGVGVERTPDGLRLLLEGEKTTAIDFALDDEARITSLALGAVTDSPASPADAAPEPLTWEGLADRFRDWETRGFSGVVLARHEGRTVLRAPYGLADPVSRRPTSLSTIYGIGSTPIDFTITGVLLLAQRGRLTLDDPVNKYWPAAPADKRTMTLRHLMTGRSGLLNFHDDPAVDWDADLAFIDRETAVRRILAQPLLFAPGTGDAHSHSAYGLLAAVIELVSGTTYQEFVRQEIFEPLGMLRTGFNGEHEGYTMEDFAVGPGPSRVGLPNIPPNWGPTSWLVMGSGGMFSTLDDMARYYAANEKGVLLQGEWARRQQGEQVGLGGSDRGFFIFHVSNGRGDSVLGIMNGEGRSPEVRSMLRAIESLVLEQ